MWKKPGFWLVLSLVAVAVLVPLQLWLSQGDPDLDGRFFASEGGGYVWESFGFSGRVFHEHFHECTGQSDSSGVYWREGDKLVMRSFSGIGYRFQVIKVQGQGGVELQEEGEGGFGLHFKPDNFPEESGASP